MSKKSGKEQYLDAKYVVENPSKFDHRDVARAREFCNGYEAGQVETIVMRESDKAIDWEVHDSVITGHVFEGNGVYIIKKFHQGDYRYLVNWRDDRKYEIIKLKESDHLLSLMKWCVQHWQLSDNVDT